MHPTSGTGPPEPLAVVRRFLDLLNDPGGPEELPAASAAALSLALRDSAARDCFVNGIASEAEALDGLSAFARSLLRQCCRTMRIGGYRVFARPQVERLRALYEFRLPFAPYRGPERGGYWDRRWKRWSRRPRRNRFIGFVTIIGPPR